MYVGQQQFIKKSAGASASLIEKGHGNGATDVLRIQENVMTRDLFLKEFSILPCAMADNSRYCVDSNLNFHGSATSQ